MQGNKILVREGSELIEYAKTAGNPASYSIIAQKPHYKGLCFECATCPNAQKLLEQSCLYSNIDQLEYPSCSKPPHHLGGVLPVSDPDLVFALFL